METWLPAANTQESMRCLHDDDLIVQIREARNLLRAMAAETSESRLLMVRMWRGYEGGLLNYVGTACQEYERRTSRHDHTQPILAEAWRLRGQRQWPIAPLYPRWYGYAPIHQSHRSTLIRQRPAYYARLWVDTPLDMPVLWPQNKKGAFDFSVTLSAVDREKVKRGELFPRLTGIYGVEKESVS
jgi:hypothetical protein